MINSLIKTDSFSIIFVGQIFLILVCVLQKFDIKYVSWAP